MMNYALNSEVARLRPEKKRILLYKLNKPNFSVEEHGFLHPTAAIFLTLIDGKKTIEEVSKQLLFITGMPSLEKVEVFITNTLRNLSDVFGEEIFIQADRQNEHLIKRYDPFKFIIKKNEIDLSGHRLDTPLDINFIITQDCNRNCIYCYAEKDKAPDFNLIPFSRTIEIIDEAKNIGVCDITFSGGEPFLRKDFVEILGHTISSGIIPFVSTKQYLSKDTCKRLKDVGLDFIQVSIDSANENIANFLTGSKNFYNQAIETTKNLKETGLFVRIKAVVTPYNIFDIPNLINIASRLRVERIQLTQYGRSAFRHRDNLFLDTDEIKWLKETIDILKSKNPRLVIQDKLEINNDMAKQNLDKEEILRIYEKRAVCSIGRTAITILPDGKVLACEQLPTEDKFIVGDLMKQSIIDVWNSERLWNLVVPPKDLFEGQACFTCEQFDDCHNQKGRCIRDAVNVYGNFYAPDPKCPYAPPSLRLT